MQLSILIPTYNYDCTYLVHQLLEQLPDEAEIVIGDDCSTDESITSKLFEVGNLPQCRTFRPSHNLGRAAIRNLIAQEAKGEWLLFIDADAGVRSQTFISEYMEAAKHALVVCGGTGNLLQCPRPAARLRYDYEVKVEKILTLSRRQKHPYAQFRTFNFLIQRELFLSIGFDGSLKEYGHEDTLFGLELKRRGITILHIDNKLINLDYEDADVFLEKSETALRVLAGMEYEQRQNVRVSAFALRLKRWHLLGLVRFLFRTSKSLLRSNLLGRHPSQLLFTFYKLGYYSNVIPRELPPT